MSPYHPVPSDPHLTLFTATGCRSHTPTLRDIFPLHQHTSTALQQKPSMPTSYLPGALPHGAKRPLPAVKRWERLVHLELADRSELRGVVGEKCDECDAIHREVFPLARTERVYEDVVVEVIERWGRFIARICGVDG